MNYYVVVEYMNGGIKELVTGVPIPHEKALQVRESLLVGARSEEYFVHIVNETDYNGEA